MFRCALCVIALGLAPAAMLAQRAPGAQWPVAKPATVGMNAAVLDSLDAEIKAGQYGYVDRMLVIRHGQVAYDVTYPHDYDAIYGDSARIGITLLGGDRGGPFNYYNPWWHPTYHRGDLHTLQSVTKTVTSAVFGVAMTRGDLKSIDVPVLSFFDTTKVANIDDRKRRMTLRHLLTMTGGTDWNENLSYADPRNTGTQMEASADWVKYTINRPMRNEPGTVYNYNSGESALLAFVFRQATGIDIEEYAARYLFAPLGIERWFWKRTPSGTADTEGGLYLEAKDLARIWYLFLHDGMWNTTRVVSHDWVRESVTGAIAKNPAATPRKNYGLLWHLNPDPLNPDRDLWTGSGFGGQVPVVFPDLDMVVVFNAWNIPGGGKPGLPLAKTLERVAKAVTTR